MQSYRLTIDWLSTDIALTYEHKHSMHYTYVEYEKDDDIFSRHYNGQREQIRSNNIYWGDEETETKTNETTTLWKRETREREREREREIKCEPQDKGPG